MRIAIVLVLALSGWVRADELTPKELEFFESKIRPILVKHCYECHASGLGTPKGGLVLDHAEGLLRGGDSGPTIVAGDVDSSLIIESLRYQALEMPPKGKLPESVIADFEKWIQMGAPDPRQQAAANKPRRILYDPADADSHWAFQPIQVEAPPLIDDPWIRNPIDAFILAALREANLEPSPPAELSTLLRRAAYDLTGLPYLGEDDKDYSQTIEELLDSRQYGVHWGRHWLDIARYADNNGDRLAKSGRNPYYPHAWTYRDWVVESFNKDLAYDQFIMHQLAADHLATHDNREPLAALGFLRVGKMFGQAIDDRIDDRIDTITKGLLGLTVSCARCHDHKFEPVYMKDYYALHGILSSSEDMDVDLLPREMIPGYVEFAAERASVLADVKAQARTGVEQMLSQYVRQTDKLLLAAQDFLDGRTNATVLAVAAREFEIKADILQAWVSALQEWESEANPIFIPWFRLTRFDDHQYSEIRSGKWPVHPIVAKRLLEERPADRDELARFYRDLAVEVESAAGGHFPLAELVVNWRNLQRRWIPQEYDPFRDAPARLADPDWEALRQVLLGFDGPWGGPQLPPQLLMRSGASPNRDLMKMAEFSLIKKDGEDPRSPVMAMIVRDLAQPVSSPVFIRGDRNNPGELVARSYLTHFSEGTPKHYTQGSGRWELACDIADRNNPLTARVIVNRVWQWHFGSGLVATSSDFGLNGLPPSHPELLDWLTDWFIEHGWSIKQLNRLILQSSTYQQSSRTRLDAAEIDPSNRLLWRYSPRQLSFEEIRDSLLLASGELDLAVGGRPTPQGENSNRRTMFLYVDRYELPYEFQTFDFANPDFSTAQRESSIVPPQALFFLNDPWVIQRARHLAGRIKFAESQPRIQLRKLWQAIYQRQPSESEADFASQLLNANNGDLSQVAHAMLCTNEFVFVR